MNKVQSNFHYLPLLYPFELDLVLSWMNEILVTSRDLNEENLLNDKLVIKDQMR